MPTGREEKSLGEVFPGATVFRSAQVGEVSAGSHQSDFLMWIFGFCDLCGFKNIKRMNHKALVQ